MAKNDAIASATTYHKLVSGTYSRWVGDKKTGKREEYDSQDPERNLIPDLSESEIRTLGVTVQAVPVEQVKVKGDATTPATSSILPASVPSPVVEVDHVQAPVIPVITSPNIPSSVSTTTPVHSELLSKSVPEIEKELEDVDNVSTLDAIRDAEVVGKQRLGVLKVIKARREKLT